MVLKNTAAKLSGRTLRARLSRARWSPGTAHRDANSFSSSSVDPSHPLASQSAPCCETGCGRHRPRRRAGARADSIRSSTSISLTWTEPAPLTTRAASEPWPPPTRSVEEQYAEREEQSRMPAEAEEEQPHGVEEHRANNSKQPAEAGGESGHVVLKNTARRVPRSRKARLLRTGMEGKPRSPPPNPPAGPCAPA